MVVLPPSPLRPFRFPSSCDLRREHRKALGECSLRRVVSVRLDEHRERPHVESTPPAAVLADHEGDDRREGRHEPRRGLDVGHRRSASSTPTSATKSWATSKASPSESIASPLRTVRQSTTSPRPALTSETWSTAPPRMASAQARTASTVLTPTPRPPTSRAALRDRQGARTHGRRRSPSTSPRSASPSSDPTAAPSPRAPP